MFFHLSVNTVNCASQNRGTLAVTIQKRRANMQSPKRRGKRAVRGQNESSYAIDPKNRVSARTLALGITASQVFN